MGEPADLSAVEARRLIGAKKLSPIELIASCLSRITATNGKINSVVAIDERVGLGSRREPGGGGGRPPWSSARAARWHQRSRAGEGHALDLGLGDIRRAHAGC